MRVGVYFHVQSHLRWGKYLESMNREVNLKTPNGRAEQLWYFDQRTKTIRNKANKKVFSIANSGRGNKLESYAISHKWW